MFFVEEFERISAQMHESEVRLEEALRAQKEEMKALQVKKEEKEKKVMEKKKKAEEATDSLKQEMEGLKEIAGYIEDLKKFEESEKEKKNEDIECLIERILKKAKTDSNLLGKCIAVRETITLRLKCNVCGKISTETNPKVLVCDPNETDKENYEGLKEKCLRCAKTKEVKIEEETKRKMKDLALISRIIKELEGLKSEEERRKDNKDKEIEQLKYELAAKNKQILDLNSQINEEEETNKQEITELNAKFQAEVEKIQLESKREIETLHAEYTEKLQKIDKNRDELEIRLEMTVESNKELMNEKEETISLLESQIKNLKEQNKEIKAELTAKHREIAENSEKLTKIQESTGLLNKELVKEAPKNSVYMMNNGKVCEINDEEGEIKVIQREKIKERDDFILWVDGKQLCGVLKDKKWTLSLYSGQMKVDSVEIVGNSKECDKFIKKDNRIYIGVYSTYELYRLTVEGKQLKLESFGKIGSYLRSVCEFEDYFFIGLGNCTINQVKQGQITAIVTMSSSVGHLKVENNCLLASDCNGKAIKYNLTTKATEKTVNVGGYYAFLFGDKIGRTSSSKLYIHDWEGNKIKELSYSGSNSLSLLKQTDKYSVLAYDTCLLTLDHATLTIKEHTTGSIPYRYLNY